MVGNVGEIYEIFVARLSRGNYAETRNKIAVAKFKFESRVICFSAGLNALSGSSGPVVQWSSG